MSTEKMRAFIIHFLFYALILALAYFTLRFVMPFLMPFLLAFLIAMLFQNPITKICEKTKQNRKLVSVLLLTVFYIVVCAVFILIGTRLAVSAQESLTKLPALYTGTIRPALMQAQVVIRQFFSQFGSENSDIVSSMQNIGDSVINALGNIITSFSGSAVGVVTSVVSGVPQFLVQFVITIVASYFFVVDYFTITSFIARQLSDSAKTMAFKLKDQIMHSLGRFGRAYGLLMLLTFTELTIGFLLLGIPLAPLWAALIALIDILPVLGTGTVLIPWSVISILIGKYPLGIGLLVLYVLITVIRQILEPRVVGKQIGLYPVVTLFCMFVGAHLFGFIGLIGLPIIAAVLLQMDRDGDISFLKK